MFLSAYQNIVDGPSESSLSLKEPTPEIAGFTVADNGERIEAVPESTPLSKNLCLFLMKFPLEIRQIIYRHLFTRPVPILPGPVHLQNVCDVAATGGFKGDPLFSVKFGTSPYAYQWDARYAFLFSVKFGTSPYAYQWDARYAFLQRGTEEHINLPDFGGKKTHHVAFEYLTKPTEEQQVVIDTGTFQRDLSGSPGGDSLDSSWNETMQQVVLFRPLIYRRGEHPTQIRHRSILDLPGIFGVQLLRTCKKIRDEAIDFLYSNNTFAFDFRAESEWNHHLIKTSRQLAMDRLPFSNTDTSHNGSMMKIQVSRNIHLTLDQFFDRDIFHARASGERFRIEPLAHFFNEIGLENTRQAKLIMFKGFFETYHTITPAGPIVQMGGGFEEVLMLAARAVQKLCPDLEELTLKRAALKEHNFDPVAGPTAISDPSTMLQCRPWTSELMNGSIRTIMGRLKNLHRLNLVNDVCCNDHNELQLKGWGSALRWEAFVEQRYAERKVLELEGLIVAAENLVVANYLDQRL